MALPQQPLCPRQAARGLWGQDGPTADLMGSFALEDLVRPDWPDRLPLRCPEGPAPAERLSAEENPEALAAEMQCLVGAEVVEAAALTPIDQAMGQEFRQTQPGVAADQRHRQGMGADMARQPVGPGNSFHLVSRTFTKGDLVALKRKVAEAMAKAEHQEQRQTTESQQGH